VTLLTHSELGDVAALQRCLTSAEDGGIKLNLQSYDARGMNALHLAVQRNHVLVVAFLAARSDVDVDAVTLPDGWTALHLAAAVGNVAIIEVLRMTTTPFSNPISSLSPAPF